MKEKLLKILVGVLFSTIILIGGINKLNAASAYISVKSSASTVIVGKEFTVTVTISSSVALGSWEYTIDYNSSLLKLQSGTSYVVDYGNGTLKSKSYTYKFKALGTGSTKIGVKSYGGYDWNETRFSMSAGSVTVTLKTQAQIEASYSKNNYLKSLSVDGHTIAPTFNKDTLEYSVQLESNIENIKITASTEDSKASLSGTGTKSVSEGENKFYIVVTAENGSTKTYTLTAIVTDPNPITVTTSTGETRTVVKREGSLTSPGTFTKTTAVINDIEVPAFYSEISKYTLVGLKNEVGSIDLYVYSSDKNTFTLYNEVTFSQVKLYPIDVEDNKFDNYKLSKITINDAQVNAYKLSNESDFAIIYGMNIETGEKNYYLYDSKDGTITRYNSEEADILNKKVKSYYSLIIGLTIESIFLLIIVIIMLIKIFSKRKTKKENKHNDIIEKKITELKNNKKKKN